MNRKTNILKKPLLIMGAILVFVMSSCKKEDYLPIASTSEVTDIILSTAISGGYISDDGSPKVTARGVCWSKNENPTINDNKTEDGAGTGSFTSSLTDLEPNTTYYV